MGGHSIPCAISWCDRRPWQALDSCQDTALAFGIKDCEAAVSRCLLVAGFHLNWHLQGLLPCLQYVYVYVYVYVCIYICIYIYRVIICISISISMSIFDYFLGCVDHMAEDRQFS